MSKEQWHSDITVNEDIVRRSIEKQFDMLTPITSLQCVGEGWDNCVYLVNEKFIFRFPRRNIAVELIERENMILKNIHDKISLDIPNPCYLGKPSSDYPYPFHGYAMIPGLSGCHAGLTTVERNQSIIPLATFLKQLHRYSSITAEKLGAKKQVFDRTDVSRLSTELTKRVEKINARNICVINEATFQNEIKIANNVQLPTGHNVLVHGDMYCRHLMFNNGQLTGVIDWGDVGINNPVVDLAVVFSFYDNDQHKAFFEIYGEISSDEIAYTRFLGLYSSLTVLLYGYDTGDTLLVDEAKSAIIRMNPDLLAN